MAERSLRGMKIGANSLETDTGVKFVPREPVYYVCPQGHEFPIAMVLEVVAPSTWECRCGQEAKLRDRDESEDEEIIKPVRNPIGLYVNEKPFESKEIQLEKGDKIYLASDGYQSQFGGATNHVLKTSGYRKILDQIHNLPMAEQRKELETRFEEWRGNYKQTDDIIVVGLQV